MFLVSKEHEKFKIDIDIASLSTLVKESLSIDSSDEHEICLSLISSNTLSLIIMFMTHHKKYPMKTIEKPINNCNMKDITGEWYANFIDIPKSDIIDLLIAANFMDVHPLLDLCCAKLASIIKDKTPDEIRDTFGITDEIDKETIDSNEWCL